MELTIKESMAQKGGNPSATTILLIEDNAPDARWILETLREPGNASYRLEQADRLSAGLDRLSRGDVGAVLLDLFLPDSKGLETLSRTRESAPDVPILVLTGLDDLSLAVKALKAGAQDFLIKGRLDANLLGRAIRYAIERERMDRERNLLLARERAAREEAEKAKGRLDFLARVSQVLVSTLEYETMLANLTRLIVPHLADYCSLELLSRAGFVSRVASAHVNPAQGALLGELRSFALRPAAAFASKKAARTGGQEWFPEVSPAILESLASDPEHRELLRRLEIKSYLCLQLEAQEGTLGTMTLAYCESGRRYSGEEVVLVEDVARRAAVGIHNARLYSEVRRADQKNDEFLAMLAHELRNPLATIRNAVEVLCIPAAGESARGAALRIIRRQIAHQSQIVEDLMNVSRIAHGKLELHPETVDLVGLVATAIEDHRKAFQEAGLELKAELPQERLWVEGDPVRLSQVMVNLLNHAAKFTARGGRIEVRVRREPGAARAVVTVKDNGQGIDQQLLPHVFEAFTQGEQSLGRTKGGLGLGLALVKGIVELHRGEARIHSAGPGQGCEVAFLLPVAREERVAKQALPVEEPAKAGSRRVLVVEDNRDAAETLSWILRSNGHRVQLAHSGPSALEVAREFRPEVVLCDLGLPGMDGYAVAAALRGEATTAKSLLVAVSGYGQEEDKQRAQKAGFDLHLTKPVDPGELEALLASPPPGPGGSGAGRE